jgi:hypothetical protein
VTSDHGTDDGTSPAPHLAGMAEEAARLLDAAQGWARRMSHDAHLSTDAPACRGCPLCQAIAVLRGDRPEVTAKIAEVAGGLADLVRGLVDTHSVDTHPVDTHPVDTHPVDTHPVDTHPVDTHPVDTHLVPPTAEGSTA